MMNKSRAFCFELLKPRISLIYKHLLTESLLLVKLDASETGWMPGYSGRRENFHGIFLCII